MIKKIFTAAFILLILLTVGNANVSAADTEKFKVAVILDAPVGMFSKPEKVYSTVKKTLDNIFKGSSFYEIIPIEETDPYVQIYREENDLVGAVTPQGVAVEAFLKKEDLDKICTHFESRYLIYIRVSSTAPEISTGFFSASQKVNVTMDFRVWADADKDFSYVKRTTATGTSTAIYAGIGSASKALEDGLKKGLVEVEKDKIKIRKAMDTYEFGNNKD